MSTMILQSNVAVHMLLSIWWIILMGKVVIIRKASLSGTGKDFIGKQDQLIFGHV
ncbi:MAG TPA: hypothetical protein VFI29_04985 [Hanamia sp.]|nr:hypothetical protein [Hanamia sp.]